MSFNRPEWVHNGPKMLPKKELKTMTAAQLGKHIDKMETHVTKLKWMTRWLSVKIYVVGLFT